MGGTNATGVGGWHRMSRCRWVAPNAQPVGGWHRLPQTAARAQDFTRCRWVAPNVPVSVGGIVRPVSERLVSVARLRPGGLRCGRGAVSVGGTDLGKRRLVAGSGCTACWWVALIGRTSVGVTESQHRIPDDRVHQGWWVTPTAAVGDTYCCGRLVGCTECLANRESEG